MVKSDPIAWSIGEGSLMHLVDSTVVLGGSGVVSTDGATAEFTEVVDAYNNTSNVIRFRGLGNDYDQVPSTPETTTDSVVFSNNASETEADSLYFDGPFTIDFWWRTELTTNPRTGGNLFQTLALNTSVTGRIPAAILCAGTSTDSYIGITTPNASNTVTYVKVRPGGNKYVEGTWVHTAFVKNERNLLMVFVDGVLENQYDMGLNNLNQTSFIEDAPVSFSTLILGQSINPGFGFHHFHGRLQDLRIINGKALNTGALFPVPETAYTPPSESQQDDYN
jgi:hypothetical protein